MPVILPANLPWIFSTTPDDDPATGGGDGDLLIVPDHTHDGLLKLIAQYQEKPRIQAWLKSILDRVQWAEQAAIDLYNDVFSLDTAEGNQLDLIGRIVQETREGRTDTAYRLALRVRVLINRSQGRLEELIKIVRLFESMDLEPGSIVRIQDVQPCRIEVRIIHTPVNAASEIHKRLRQAKAAAVALSTITTPVRTGTALTRSFVFGLVSAYPLKNTTRGFGNTLNASTGGYWANVLG